MQSYAESTTQKKLIYPCVGLVFGKNASCFNLIPCNG